MFMAAALLHAQSPTPTVVETTVIDAVADRSLTALAAGRAAGIALGDPFWLFKDAQLTASGHVQMLDDRGAAGTTDGLAAGSPRQSAAILCRSSLVRHIEHLPPEVTVRGRIARVAPGRRSGWLNLGADAGLQPGDRLLIRRSVSTHFDLPLARGKIELVRDESALAVFDPIVGNALPQPNDTAEIWPSPSDRRLGRVESTVLEVKPSDREELILTLAGTAADGLEVGRLVDLFRGRDYVGHATVVQIREANSLARTVRAGQKQPPQPGDRAWVRPPPGPPPRPLSTAIFQIDPSPDGDVALLAAGDTDGLQVGEEFLVRHQDAGDPRIRRDVAILTIRKVNEDFATAQVQPVSADGERVQQWDLAERRRPPSPDWREVGIVQQVSLKSRAAAITLEPGLAAGPGTVVRWIPEPAPADQARRPAGAAMIIHRSQDEAILYVPPGWGQVDYLANARIELAAESSSVGP